MSMAWLEPIASIVRVGADGSKHEDPYHFAATVRYIDSSSVEVCGLVASEDAKCVQCGSVSHKPGIAKEDWHAIIDLFKSQGIERIMYKRIKHGKVRVKWLKIG